MVWRFLQIISLYNNLGLYWLLQRIVLKVLASFLHYQNSVCWWRCARSSMSPTTYLITTTSIYSSIGWKLTWKLINQAMDQKFRVGRSIRLESLLPFQLAAGLDGSFTHLKNWGANLWGIHAIASSNKYQTFLFLHQKRDFWILHCAYINHCPFHVIDICTKLYLHSWNNFNLAAESTSKVIKSSLCPYSVKCTHMYGLIHGCLGT